MHKLTLENVCKTYGTSSRGVDAISNVNLEVRKGEFVTLLGPSGSGKSTLLKIIAGMIESTSGRIIIDGMDATKMPANQRGLGMVFQNYALIPHMSVFENVAFGLRVRKLGNAEIERKVRGALETVRLDQLHDRKPAALSGGQQQRVAIARAIVYDPSLVLMDEPLGALDKKLREQMQAEISSLQRRLGITMLYVTHDQGEALTMSDRIVLMNQGRIEQIGSPSEMYLQPATVFSADFLGESNFIDADATSEAGVFRMASGDIISVADAPALVRDARVSIMIRPEHIEIGPAGANVPPGMQDMAASVKAVTFQGGTTRIALSLAGDVSIDALQVGRSGLRGLEPGMNVSLSWPGDCPKVFARN